MIAPEGGRGTLAARRCYGGLIRRARPETKATDHSGHSDASVGRSNIAGVATIVAMPTREELTDGDETEVIGRIPGQRGGRQDPSVTAPGKKKRKKRKKSTTILLVCGCVLLLLVGLGVIGTTIWLHSVTSSVKRVNAFDKVPEADRPKKEAVAKDAMNYLLLGSDTRDPSNTDGSRSDTIMMLHIDKTHSKASIVSIPRDTYTYIPKMAGATYGNTNSKINAAFSWGGVPGTVTAVERFTGVRVDHVVLVDFAGFKDIVDALGGVQINVPKAFDSTHSLNPGGKRHFDAGLQTMDGAAALDYSRERYAFKNGDFQRIQDQQQVIRAIMDKGVSGGIVSNPARLNAFLQASAKSVTVDSTLNIFTTAADLRNIHSSDITFLTNPSSGTGTEGDQSVVLPDLAKDKLVWQAVRDDTPIPPTS
jgi:LCP family protein required for cell wall assembly